MRVEFLDKFNRDLDKIRSKPVKKSVEKAILAVEQAGSIRGIPKIKKLTGHKSAYRIRVGDYRVGVFVEKQPGRVCTHCSSKRYLRCVSLTDC